VLYFRSIVMNFFGSGTLKRSFAIYVVVGGASGRALLGAGPHRGLWYSIDKTIN